MGRQERNRGRNRSQPGGQLYTPWPRKRDQLNRSPDHNREAHDYTHFPRILTYTSAATLTTDASSRIYPPRGGQIAVVHLNVQTAPSGSAMTVDVLVNGVTIFNDSAYPQIEASEISSGTESGEFTNESFSVPDAEGHFAAFDYIQIQIVAINSAGGPLVAQLEIDWED